MSKSDLDLIIETLEKECSNLRSQLELCLDIQDYSNAQHYNDLFFLKQRELNLFKSLKFDEYHSREGFVLKREIARYKLQVQKASFDYKKRMFFEAKMKEKELELQEWLNGKVKPTIDTDKLAFAIEQLLEDKYGLLELVLDESLNFKITLSKLCNKCLLKIMYDQNARRQVTNDNEGVEKLKSIGFTFVEEDPFIIWSTTEKFKVNKLLLLFSRIIFEVFGGYQLKHVKLVCIK